MPGMPVLSIKMSGARSKEGFTSQQGGFTLIEVIMIIVVAAIAIPVLLVMIGQKARLGVNPELQVSASNVGQSMLEDMKAKDFAGVVSGSDTLTVGGVSYARDAQVCYVDPLDLKTCVGGPTDYKLISLTVSYALPGGQSYIKLDTLVTDH